MPYEVTATRRRPKSFDSLEGQEFVVSTLKNSLRSGRIAHAYLFAGPRGVGKTSAARILARALNCPDGPSADGCPDSAVGDEISRGASLDVIEIDGASNTSVNDVRQIKDEVLFAPQSARYKIYIIDEVHMLSNSAFNALLKTIEEPPPYIVFIFATTEIHKVPATIRSRCQQFNFQLIAVDRIKTLLVAAATELALSATDEALFWIAKEATGSLRDAYTLFDQVVSFSDGTITIEKIREKLGLVGFEQLNELAEAIAQNRPDLSIAMIDRVMTLGVSVEQFTIDLTDYFRSLLFVRVGIVKESVLGYAPERFSQTVRSALTRSQLEKAVEILLELFRNLRYTLNPRLELELAVSRLAGLSGYLSPTDLLTEIRRLQAVVGVTWADSEEPEPNRSGDSAEASAGLPRSAYTTADDDAELPHADRPAGGTADSPRHSAHAVPIDRQRDVVTEVKKQKIALAAAIDKATHWDLSGNELHLHFASDYAASAVTEGLTTISPIVATVFGPGTRVVVHNHRDNDRGNDVTHPKVEMVKRVFRGEIVERS